MKDSIVFYRSFYETIMQIENEKDQLALFKSICEYGLNENETGLAGINKLLFGLIKPQLDANNYKSKLGKKNGIKGKDFGKLGGRPPKQSDYKEDAGNPQGVISETPKGLLENPQGVIRKPLPGYSENPQRVFQKPPNVNVNENGNENVNENGNENEIKKRDKSPKKSSAKASTSAKASQEIIPLRGEAEPSLVKTRTADGAAAAKQKTFKQWSSEDLIERVEPFRPQYGNRICDQFVSYWSEPTASGKIRVNQQDAFEIKRRLDTFLRNSKEKHIPAQPEPTFKTKAEAEQFVIDTYFRGKQELSPKHNYNIEIADDNGNPRNIEDIRREVDAKIRGQYA